MTKKFLKNGNELGKEINSEQSIRDKLEENPKKLKEYEVIFLKSNNIKQKELEKYTRKISSYKEK